jgi:hypothetical protein
MVRTSHPWSRQAKELGLRAVRKWSGKFNLPDFHAWCERIGVTRVSMSTSQQVTAIERGYMLEPFLVPGRRQVSLAVNIQPYPSRVEMLTDLLNQAQKFVGRSALVERVDINHTADGPTECRLTLVLMDPECSLTN